MAVAPVSCRAASRVPRPQKFLPASKSLQGAPKLVSPTTVSVQARAPKCARLREAGRPAGSREGEPQSGKHKARVPEDAGATEGSGGAHARRVGGGADGAGAGRRGEGGKRAPWSPAESGEGVDAEGAGPGEAGTRSRAGKAGARRWRERARSPPLFPTLPSTSDRPELRSGSARRSPEPPLAFSPHPRPRRARQSPHDALLHLGHGWVSAGWPLGGCAGLVSFSASRPAEAGEQGAAPVSGGAARGRARRQGPGGRWGPSAAVSASCARRPRHVRPSQSRGALGKRRRAGAGVPGQPPHTSSQKMVRGAGGGGG